VQPALGVLVDEEALFLFVRLVENDPAAGVLARCHLRVHGSANCAGEAGPLAEITCTVEVRHPRRMLRKCIALMVTDHQEALFLIQISHEEVLEQAAEQVEVKGLLVIADPAVTHRLKNQGNAVHLAIRTQAAAIAPAEAIGPDDVRQHLQILFSYGPEARQFAIAQMDVAVKLQRLTNEDQGHGTVNVETAANPAVWAIVEVAGAAVLLHALHIAVDQFAGLVFFGKTHAVASDRFSDIEGLEMVLVVGASQQAAVELFARRIEQTFPHRIPLLGGTEAEEAEGCVAETIFAFCFGKRLRGDAPRCQIDQVVTLEFDIVCGVSRLIAPWVFTFDRLYRAVGVERTEVVAEHSSGHIQTLVREVLHYRKPGEIRSGFQARQAYSRKRVGFL